MILGYWKIALICLFLFVATILLLWWEAKTSARNFVYPDSGSYLEVDGFQIFYRQEGEGEDIVFVHGLGASQHIWQDVVDALKPNHFRATLIDLPGFGRSSKIREKSYDLDSQTDRLHEILNQLGLKSTYIVGSSMGGAISLWLAKKYPDQVKKIIVIGPATSSKLQTIPFYRWPQLSYIAQFFNNRILMNITLRIILNRHELITSSRVNYSMKNQHQDPYALYTFLKSMETLDDHRMPKELSSIKQPVLILGGKKDFMIPPRFLKELHKVILQSELYFHKEGGHHLMEDEPLWVANHLIEFLK